MFEIMNLCQTTSVFEDARNLIVLLSTVQVNEKIVHKQKIKTKKGRRRRPKYRGTDFVRLVVSWITTNHRIEYRFIL